MDSVLQLIIGAAVVCLVVYLAKVLIGPGESHVSPDPTVEPPQIDHTISAGGSSAPLAAPVPSPPEPRALTRVANIPKCVIFFDVETTGLNSNDRVVTLAAVKLLNTDLLPSASLEYLYLIFDPGRKSHPGAEAIHGYSDWILRHQENFGTYAETIENFFNSSELVVAHNADFDIGFYDREMQRAGRSPIAKPIYCTMNGYREQGFVGSASLAAICQSIGVARATRFHGALEDAWLAMRVYLWLNQRDVSGEIPAEFTGQPSNMKPAPPLPVGPLPRRHRKKIVTAEGETATTETGPSLPPAALQ
jgi:DNA polymerase III subunit epsilon